MILEKEVINEIQIKTLEDKELYEILIDRVAEDPWHKFKTINLKYFKDGKVFPESYSHDEKNVFFCAFYNKQLIGMLKLKTGGRSSIFHEGWKNWVCFISIQEDFQSKGISRKLIRSLFKYAKEKSLNVLQSGYSKLGFERTKKIFNEESKNFGVEFLDERNEIEFD